ncbi:YqgE/AlgH family protein [Shewanella sp. H8]|uniref:YqgE/AlgH family protein n=1 Tax=Shewanella sp. H8 TaxID=3342676 RepID=UPI003314BDED
MDNFKDHFLIAMPSLDDTFFERAVIYICEHDKKGAMGLMVNRPIGVEVEDLLEQMELYLSPEFLFSLDSQVLIGGPVAPERGFVLHTPQPHWLNSTEISEHTMLTSSRDILAAIGSKKSPEHFIVALGYAGWGKDQLEQEIADNTWLTIKATPELLFSIDHEQMWQVATQQLGFDIWQMSSQIGHA